MPRPVACPHCGEELDVPPEFRGREVRCAVCQRTFTPPAEPGGGPLAADPGPPRSRPDDPYRDRLDDRPPPRRKRKSTAWVWVLLLGSFGVCGLGCCGTIIWAVSLDHPDLQPYDSPDKQFHAAFPGPPATTTERDERGNTRHKVEFERGLPPERFFVHYVDLEKAPEGKAADKALDDACDRAAKKVPVSTQASRTSGTAQGYPSRDQFVRHPDGSATIVRFVLAGRRLYAVGITGAGLAPQSHRLTAFQDEFEIKSAGPVAVEK